jgi:hypothetical protein
MLAIVLLALAVHGPLLMMQLPINSYDTNLHIFMASHYAQHWFNPWNEKWFTGFSQTTYPAMQQQWMALFSHVMGLNMAYMVVQLISIMLLPVGMYRFARLWVTERAAMYAAIGSIFLGSLTYLVYQAGQISTTTAAPLYLNALPYLYEWMRTSRGRALLKGVLLALAAAAAHHVTLLFGAIWFALPVLWKAIQDHRDEHSSESTAGILIRGAIFAVATGIGVAIVLLPYWIALIQNPINQMPIPHASRENFLLAPNWGVHYWIIPYGALILALPFIFWRGATDRKLRPLFCGFWLTFMFGLGGTTPLAQWVFQRAFFVLTFERFTFWATLMALPIVAIMAVELVDRYQRKALVPLWVAAVGSCSLALAWITLHPINITPFDVKPVYEFLNRENHSQYRYMTLGFGTLMSRVATYTNASSVDGEYNSARLLPEMTKYGSAALTSSKFYGTNGMESLRAILKHANQYGLRYVFVRDKWYEPLLAFAGWRKIEVYDDGQVALWSKDDVPPAHKMEFGTPPPEWQGIMWGTLPIGCSILALLAVLMLPDKRRYVEPIEFPVVTQEPAYAREAK